MNRFISQHAFRSDSRSQSQSHLLSRDPSMGDVRLGPPVVPFSFLPSFFGEGGFFRKIHINSNPEVKCPEHIGNPYSNLSGRPMVCGPSAWKECRGYAISGRKQKTDPECATQTKKPGTASLQLTSSKVLLVLSAHAGYFLLVLSAPWFCGA